jgi:hypothetical protein
MADQKRENNPVFDKLAITSQVSGNLRLTKTGRLLLQARQHENTLSYFIQYGA